VIVDASDLAGRRDRHSTLSRRLAALDDDGLMGLLDGPPTPGFGGAVATATVDGVPVFVKFVPLTDLEREHTGSTANLFHLPTFYQYGIGSAGFGAWREIAVHDMTTRWVLDGEFDGFPLVYHRRVVPYRPAPTDPAELERWVTHWEGDDAVRARLAAIGAASAAVIVFMEHLPQTVDAWLTEQVAADGALEFVRDGVADGVAFMGERGLLHFDAHYRNLLTDGRRVYFADFGLAVHRSFDLDEAERDFLRRHRDYDRAHTTTHLVRWLVSTLLGLPWSEVHGHLRKHAAVPGAGLRGPAAEIVAEHTPVAMVTGDFFEELWQDKRSPFPAAELAAALTVRSRRSAPAPHR
jgi:hypothetical protein